MLDNLRKSNPKAFYKRFSKRRTNSGCTKDKLGIFYEHFRNIASSDAVDNTHSDSYADSEDEEAVFDELDSPITQLEIVNSIKRLKKGKAHSIDLIVNEMLIEFKDILLPSLVDMFNKILSSGYFPSSWSSAVIVPVFKKGDRSEPNNYRDISLISCLCKLFTSILNERLLNWSVDNDIVTDAQFGFRPKMGTSEAIVALHSIIHKTLSCKRRLYCCFIDYKKAFDSVDRNLLWYKLSKCGIRGKLLTVIKSMYSNVKSCVSVEGLRSDFFRNSLGLMQGEVLSPILFSLFINDFEMQFLRDGCVPVELQDIHLFLLMYADDMVLFSESIDGLQHMLNSLYTYSKNWNLEVNIQKTKIVIFRNGGIIRENEFWLYNGEKLEVLNEFCYLGVILNYNGKFLVCQKQLARQGRKAMFAMRSNVSDLMLNHCTLFSLFDTYVTSIISYGSEVWGMHAGKDIEKVHLDYCKHVLGVNKRTNNVLTYAETGRLPLKVWRLIRIFKFWFKLLRTENCILGDAYKYLLMQCNDVTFRGTNWLKSVKTELFRLGLGYMWTEQNTLSFSKHFPVIKQKIIDICVQGFIADINSSQRCVVYKHLIDHVTLQFYLCKPIPMHIKKYITKIRLSSHNLHVESGRTNNTPRAERTCFFCNLDVEDEFHFILKCPVYVDIRKKYIKKYYWERPSAFKLTQLLSVNNVKELCALGKYIRDAFKLRSNLLR